MSNNGYDNYTLYGIHDKNERSILACYSSALFVSSVLGDTLILVGSLRYNAIRLHRVMVCFIQYIAVADLAMSLFRALPGSVSLVTNDWILGKFLCYIDFIVTCCAGITFNLLISALSLTKLLILKYPLRAVTFSTKPAHLTALIFFICSIFPPVMVMVVDKQGVNFSYRDYNCDYTSSSHVIDLYKEVSSVTLGLVGVITTTTTVVSSVMLLVIARKLTERDPNGLRWQGIMTVLLTAAVYLIATLPGALYFLGLNLVKSNQSELSQFWHVTLFRIAAYVILLNMLSNFYIYTLTLPSFREFLKSRIRFSMSFLRLSRSVEPATNDEIEERRNLLN